ncbi:hypothetical protein PGTUg99_029703 [Puccinia graminis f. sp. tritici]|uniref:Uncharacterized protein n=1 Tax=Puccinia graminis f. sp. tritici TaxID=56615 RepID=A0A5B0RES2_PUCGR|nr:hypothetical protein PGTUg99_029703 [Puccinia graminis f. sp. tritici]
MSSSAVYLPRTLRHAERHRHLSLLYDRPVGRGRGFKNGAFSDPQADSKNDRR